MLNMVTAMNAQVVIMNELNTWTIKGQRGLTFEHLSKRLAVSIQNDLIQAVNPALSGLDRSPPAQDLQSLWDPIEHAISSQGEEVWMGNLTRVHISKGLHFITFTIMGYRYFWLDKLCSSF